jgi:hypothetical protein
LSVNAALVWNTMYAQAQLSMLEEDVARLSPLKWAHINVLGRFEFTMSPDVAGGDLRPLRDPNAFVVDDVAESLVMVSA